MVTTVDGFFPLTRLVHAVVDCDESTLTRIQAFHGKTRAYCKNSEFCAEGDLEQRICVVVSGWMLRTRLLSDGRRQILGYVLPGSLLNFSLYSQVPAFCDYECVTDVVLADVSALRQHVLMERGSDPITTAIGTLLALEDAIAMNAIARLTRQSAFERVAHLLLDLRFRLSLVGQADDYSFELPLTQQALGETLGLSVVHVNRVLRQLEKEGLIERFRKHVFIPDTAKLRRRVDHTLPFAGFWNPARADAARNLCVA